MYSMLETKNLWLKDITPSFIHQLITTCTEEEVCTTMGCAKQDYEHYKSMHELGMETHRISLYAFLLIDKKSELPIGECGFHTWNKTHRRAEIFYVMRNELFKNRGLMKEAVEAVLNFGFTQLNLHRVEALIDANNLPSLKILQRFKFKKEGIMREDYVVNGKNEDSDCYSLLKWEWDNQRTTI